MVDKLAAALHKALDHAGVRERLNKLGGSGPASPSALWPRSTLT